jgi:hypothetical protein
MMLTLLQGILNQRIKEIYMTESKMKPEDIAAKDKPKTPDDTEQSKRFIDMAREVEGDDTEGAFEKAFEKVIPSAVPPKSQKNP